MRRKKVNWTTMLEEWSSGGLSASDFCKKHGLAISGFYKAKKRLDTDLQSISHPKFVEVSSVLQPPDSSYRPSPTLRITSKDGHILEVFL